MPIVDAGGLKLLTDDPIMIAVAQCCAEFKRERDSLERQLLELHHLEVARFRTLRSDVRQIKKTLVKEPHPA
jgi:DNA integrity scanning protein DisA with diadenylate cyclase activity